MSLPDPRLSMRRVLRLEPYESRLVLAHPVSVAQSVEEPVPVLEIGMSEVQSLTDVQYAHQVLGLVGYGQTVVVVDSGIAYDHPALGGGFGAGYRVVGGWDFTEENDGDPYDDAPAGFHGTHVAGIIGSSDVNHPGVAPAVDLVALRVFNDQGKGDFQWIEDALDWVSVNKDAFEYPITTVNLSLGTKWTGGEVPEWAILEDELAELHRQGIFVTVAAGNNFEANPVVGLNYPATSPHVVAVASHGDDRQISDFSRRSDRVLVAPGEHITSTAPDYVEDFNGITDDFFELSGTSMAAPYVAGASVLVRQAMQRAGRRDVTPDAIYDVLRRTAQRVYDPQTQAFYHHVDLRAALDEVLDVPPSIDLGTVSLTEISTANSASAIYAFQAARTGLLTVESFGEAPRAGAEVRLFDANKQSVADRVLTAGTGRIDLRVTAGEQLYFEVVGGNSSTRVRLANLISAQSGVLNVFGTNDADNFRVSLAGPAFVSVNGVRYPLAANSQQAVQLHGLAGDDTLRIVTSSRDETAWLAPGTVRLTGGRYAFESDGVENNYVYSSGGADLARLHDSPGDDVFTGLPNYSVLSGAGFFNYVYGFSAVRGYSSQGGSDLARLFDSAGQDTFVGLPTYGVLAGTGFENYVQGFARVDAYAIHGGHDTARLYDSPGDDILYALPDYAVMEGERFRHYVRGFAAVRAYAYQGGTDTARLFDSPGDDTFYGLPEYAVLAGNGFDNYVNGFELVRAYGHQGGHDEARLYGSSGNDRFYSLPEYAAMAGAGFDNYATGFDLVRAFGGQAGTDVAHVQGTRTDMVFTNPVSVQAFFGLCYHSQRDSIQSDEARPRSGAANPDGAIELMAREEVERQGRLKALLKPQHVAADAFWSNLQPGERMVAAFGFQAVDYLLQPATS